MREEMSLGCQEAFEIFKRDHADSVTIDDNKQILKQRFSEAKALGESINETRNKIGSGSVPYWFPRYQSGEQEFPIVQGGEEWYFCDFCVLVPQIRVIMFKYFCVLSVAICL
ncbi:kinesin-like protein KIF6-like protein [Cricetulus griseus]|uniref:Kinesin-like protein KIF6-like protein n=1 Tax=Cricetulus griseus TaxID=10029 RepID=A0A061IQZ9_CRIGR|nr:kinesin-like protein KIF6-like protein [Cricetulus griseus]